MLLPPIYLERGSIEHSLHQNIFGWVLIVRLTSCLGQGWLYGPKALQNIKCFITVWHIAGYKSFIQSDNKSNKTSSCQSLWSLLLQVVVFSRYGLMCYSVDSRHFCLYYLNHSSFKSGSGHSQFHVATLNKRTPRQYFVLSLYEGTVFDNQFFSSYQVLIYFC